MPLCLDIVTEILVFRQGLTILCKLCIQKNKKKVITAINSNNSKMERKKGEEAQK